MARVYDVVCLKCGEVMEWCKYDPPFYKCYFCGQKLVDRSGDWSEERVRVFGVWSTGEAVHETSKRLRLSFFREHESHRFRLKDKRICVVELKEYPEFWFHVRAGGERVSLLYRDSDLSEAKRLLAEYGHVWKGGLLIVAYQGVTYSPHHATAQLILEAVAENIKPERAAVIN